MLKKLVVAGAVVAAVASVGLVAPAHAATWNDNKGDTVNVTCIGPFFGAKKVDNTLMGGVAGVLSAAGNAVSDIVHGQDWTRFNYGCANGPIKDIGNTFVSAKKDK